MSKKMGRPPLDPNDRLVSRSVTLSQTDNVALQEIADSAGKGTSVALLIREAIALFLDTRGKDR